ncbi:MAG: flagellar protein FlgN [Pseudomonadota bacterium]
MPSPSTTLRDENESMTTLLDLLKQEQQCLVSADTDGLTALTPRKAELITRMATLAAERHQSLAQSGHPDNDGGMASWLPANGDAAAAALWQDLLEHTRAAKEVNRVNGMLISKQLAHNQNVLNAMRTPAGNSAAGTYGPNGQPITSGASRRFVIG